MVSAHMVSARCESKTVTAPEAAYRVACLDDEHGKEMNSLAVPGALLNAPGRLINVTK